MKQYKELLQAVLTFGTLRGERTGTGALSTFGLRAEFNLQQGFPVVTGKYVPYKLVVSELLWFLQGNPDIQFLHANNNHIWDEWVKEDGTFGPIYGAQWRNWGGNIDQLAQVIDTIKTNPTDRRMLVSAWNPSEIKDMALPPCHSFFQFYVRQGHLDCQMYQRSCDMFLGVPFNIASYATLIHLVAHVTGLKPGKLIWVGGDCHIYNNHITQVEEYLTREHFALPTLNLLTSTDNIDNFKVDDIHLEGYHHGGTIKADISI